MAVDFVEAGAAAADGAATGIEIAVADMHVNLANRAGRRAAQGPNSKYPSEFLSSLSEGPMRFLATFAQGEGIIRPLAFRRMTNESLEICATGSGYFPTGIANTPSNVTKKHSTLISGKLAHTNSAARFSSFL